MPHPVLQARNLGSIPDSSASPLSFIQAVTGFAHFCCLNTSQLLLSPFPVTTALFQSVFSLL